MHLIVSSATYNSTRQLINYLRNHQVSEIISLTVEGLEKAQKILYAFNFGQEIFDNIFNSVHFCMITKLCQKIVECFFWRVLSKQFVTQTLRKSKVHVESVYVVFKMAKWYSGYRQTLSITFRKTYFIFLDVMYMIHQKLFSKNI